MDYIRCELCWYYHDYRCWKYYEYTKPYDGCTKGEYKDEILQYKQSLESGKSVQDIARTEGEWKELPSKKDNA